MSFNNFLNAFTNQFSNEICYDFKIRKTIYVIIAIKNLNKNVKTQLDNFEAKRFRYRQEVANVIFYVSILFKIKYDFMHTSLLLKANDRAFFRLHCDYTLLDDKHNKKLNNQRIGLFLVKRRISRLAYELDLPSR